MPKPCFTVLSQKAHTHTCIVLSVVMFSVSHGVTNSRGRHLCPVVIWSISETFCDYGWLPWNCRDTMSPVGICVTPWDMENITTGSTIYRQLRARRALSIIKEVLSRTRMGLLLYKVYDDSTLLVLNGTSLNNDSTLLALNWQFIKVCGTPMKTRVCWCGCSTPWCGNIHYKASKDSGQRPTKIHAIKINNIGHK